MSLEDFLQKRSEHDYIVFFGAKREFDCEIVDD